LRLLSFINKDKQSCDLQHMWQYDEIVHSIYNLMIKTKFYSIADKLISYDNRNIDDTNRLPKISLLLFSIDQTRSTKLYFVWSFTNNFIKVILKFVQTLICDSVVFSLTFCIYIMLLKTRREFLHYSYFLK
jgi:hypothetical protein